jgi:hypothetical protein
MSSQANPGLYKLVNYQLELGLARFKFQAQSNLTSTCLTGNLLDLASRHIAWM